MKLVRVHAPGEYRIDDVTMPNPGPRDVVVKMGACGICGSDIHFVQWGMRQADGEPMPLGHESAGIVETVGAEVTGIEPGARVFVNPMAADGSVIGNGGPEGAFSPRVLVRNAVAGQSLLPIPDGISLATAALVEPLAVAMHGVNRGQPTAESQVAVFGCGPIGLGAILWLKRRGVRHVAAVDISAARLGYAQKMGADAVINPLEQNVAEALRAVHGEGGGEGLVGTDVFLDMAGAKTVIPDILKMAKQHSRLVVTAVYLEPIPVDFMSLILREVEITTAGGYPRELHDVLAQLPDVDPEMLKAYVSHTLPFEQFDEAFRIAQQPDSAKVMVTFS